jgi:hypothetical protein
MIEFDILRMRVMLVKSTDLRQDAEKFVRGLRDPRQYGEEGFLFIGTPLFPSTLDKLLAEAGYRSKYIQPYDLEKHGALEYHKVMVTPVVDLSPENMLRLLRSASTSLCYPQIDSDILAFLRRSREKEDYSRVGWLLYCLWNTYFDSWDTDEFADLLYRFTAIAAGETEYSLVDKRTISHATQGR